MATAKLQRIRNAARRVRPPTASRIPPPSSAATDAYAKSFGDDSNGAPMLLTPSKNSVFSGSSGFMLPFLHLEVPPLMPQTTMPYLSCPLISGHLGMLFIALTLRR